MEALSEFELIDRFFRRPARHAARGFFALADAYGVDLVGGDTTKGPLNLCVTILGEVPAGQALRRRGARPGDAVFVSGRLGDAALALAHHRQRVILAADELPQCE